MMHLLLPGSIATWILIVDQGLRVSSLTGFEVSSRNSEASINWKCLAFVHNSDAWKTKSKTCFDAWNATTAGGNAFCEASETYATCLTAIYDDSSLDDCKSKEVGG
jgi:hypothetical protein